MTGKQTFEVMLFTSNEHCNQYISAQECSLSLNPVPPYPSKLCYPAYMSFTNYHTFPAYTQSNNEGLQFHLLDINNIVLCRLCPIYADFITSIIILLLTHFREMLWTRTPLNWRQVEGCESHEWKEQHTRTRPNSSTTHQK